MSSAINRFTAPMKWKPSSDSLQFLNGIWQPSNISSVSYPIAGNEVCFQVEDSSYWFAHRNQCILEVVRQFSPAGTIYDIGGGNGFVALGLQDAGWDVALVEPGQGALNASRRGLNQVVWAALEDTGFKVGSLPAAAAFDVIEHIENDVDFLTTIRSLLQPGGRFYCTVPSVNALWSDEDVHAGHFRRYSRAVLSDTLKKAGLEVEFITPFFVWLTLPVFLLRALPFRLWGGKAEKRGTAAAVQSDHRLPPALATPVCRLHRWELSRLRLRRVLPFGTSLLCVARASLS